jgi:hypothetical protein
VPDLTQLLEIGDGLRIVRRPDRRHEERLGPGPLGPPEDASRRAGGQRGGEAGPREIATVDGGAGLQVEAAELGPVPMELVQSGGQVAELVLLAAGPGRHLGRGEPPQEAGVEAVAGPGPRRRRSVPGLGADRQERRDPGVLT